MNTTTFNFKRTCIIRIWYILKKIGIQDTDMLLYGLKKCNIRYIIRWIVGSKYFFIDEGIYEHALKFSSYIYNENKEAYIQKLVNNTDKESKSIIEEKVNYIETILEHQKTIIKKNKKPMNNINKVMSKYIKHTGIKLPLPYYDDSVFYYKHGINEVPEAATYTQNKDIIDCWAFIWDSALMFEHELPIQKIYCLEPEAENFILLKTTITKNKKNNKIIAIKKWVWAKKEKIYIHKMWAGSFVSNTWDYAIYIDTIDNIVKEENINPGVIKRDIEWLEYDSILWAEATIKKYKPILLISIYHNGKDFFEIKPLIESWNLWYKFKIRHLKSNHPFADTTLIAYI